MIGNSFVVTGLSQASLHAKDLERDRGTLFWLNAAVGGGFVGGILFFDAAIEAPIHGRRVVAELLAGRKTALQLADDTLAVSAIVKATQNRTNGLGL